MAKQSLSTEEAADTKLAAGVQTYFAPANVTITVAGAVVTPAEMAAAIQSRLKATATAVTSHTAMKQAVAARETTMASTQSLVDAIKQVALIMYANQPDVLTVFGIAPRKVPAPLTAAQLAERAVKAAATRKARGTMGPKQKAKVTGTVAPEAAPSPAPSPTASAAPTPAATPVVAGRS
jgi:hypothetical protein